MKQLLYIFFLFTLISLPGFSQLIELSGTFQGDNLFVKNPFAPEGVGFCVYEVTVNGLTSTDEINSSAFEVNLSVYGFETGEPLIVAIKYKDGCKPMVLNPEVLKPRSTFVVTNISIDNNRLNWTTSKESGSLPFIVQQYRWNKWIEVGRVTGKGFNSPNNYKTAVRLHSGKNRFRVIQIDHKGTKRYSQEISTLSTRSKVTFSPNRVDDIITFSAPTMYEIYDEYGGIIFKGYGDKVNVQGIEKGKYYLNLDNHLETFVKK
jgi:hypothetical protein